MNKREREQHIDAYVRRKLAEMAEEREGDLRVSVASLVNSEVTFDISEFQSGEWKVIHERVSQHIVGQATQGCFIYRNQSLICGDYRRRDPVVLLSIPCVMCGREYSFPQHGPSQLSVNGYCSVGCAIAAGVAPGEAVRQSQERMVYIGE